MPPTALPTNRSTSLLSAALACLPGVLALGALPPEPTTVGTRVERHLGMMGTSLALSVEHEDRRRALLASEAAVVELERVEARLSTWRETSELSRLNRAPVGERVLLTPELHSELARAREFWELTDGAFDPTVGSSLRAWEIREGGRLPTPSERTAAVVSASFHSLRLSEHTEAAAPQPWAERLADNLRIEEGGFGKGLGLDRARAALDESGASSARLDLGGQVLVSGRTEEVSLADPRDRSVALLSVSLSSGSMATSGNSERSVEIEGKRVSHIFHPRTGEPVADFGSLTVIASDAFTADALSTGLYVLGPERALELVRTLEGVELIILDSRQSTLHATLTEGLRSRVTILDPAIEVAWAF